MKITGQHNISIISEALAELSNNFETRLMNQRFANEAEKQLLCAKLRATRSLHKHVHAAGMSDQISKTLVIQ